MLGIRGNWSGRKIQIDKDNTNDALGRWSTMHLQGRNNQVITIFSVYRVSKYEGGKGTAYQQQQVDLIKYKKKVLDPREELCKDLKK